MRTLHQRQTALITENPSFCQFSGARPGAEASCLADSPSWVSTAWPACSPVPLPSPVPCRSWWSAGITLLPCQPRSQEAQTTRIPPWAVLPKSHSGGMEGRGPVMELVPHPHIWLGFSICCLHESWIGLSFPPHTPLGAKAPFSTSWEWRELKTILMPKGGCSSHKTR